MLKSEDVQMGLQCIKEEGRTGFSCHQCPYYEIEGGCNQVIAEDAIELLKENEETIKFLSSKLQEYHKVLYELTELGVPHNFQREQPWLVKYMYDITKIVKEAFEVIINDPD